MKHSLWKLCLLHYRGYTPDNARGWLFKQITVVPIETFERGYKSLNDNLIPDTSDMETFIFAEDKLEHPSNALAVYEKTNDILIPTRHSKNSFKLYLDNDDQWTKSAKKKKKHKKKKNNNFLSCIPQSDATSLFEQQMFFKDSVIRDGYNIPAALIFNPRRESAFLFGKTLSGDFVGKRQGDDGHIAIIGGSGSGKTTGLAIPTTLTWHGSIFSFDFKGDLIKWAKRRKPKILYMLRGQENHYWYDPFYFLRKDDEDNLIQNARELAHAIIPMPHNVSEPFWVESARDVLTGAIVYYFNLGKTFIGSIIEIKTTKISDLLKKISLDEFSSTCVNLDLELNPKTLAGVSMELHNQISVFATDTLIQDVLSPSEDTSKEIIRWEDLENSDIFIRLDQSKLDQWRSVMRLMLVQLMRTLQRRPEKDEPEGAKVNPTLLMLDEFPQYGRIDVITSSLKIFRSKNVTVSIFCQSLADLDETYGGDTRRAILDNCPYKAILGASDAETQRYCSDLVGTVKVPSKGLTANFDEAGQPSGYSVSIHETREPIIHPHEFASLSDIVLLHPNPERYCRVEKEMYFRRSPSQELIENRSEHHVSYTD